MPQIFGWSRMSRAMACGFRLRERVLARAVFLRRPVGGEVAVHVAVERHFDGYVDAVEVADPAFRIDAVILAALFAGLALHHDPGFGGALLPLAFFVADPHPDDVAVAVDILGDEALDAVETRHEPAVAAPIVVGRQERKLGSVRIDARQDVENLLVYQAA